MGKYNIPYVERDGIFYPCITFSEDVPIGKVEKYGLMWITYMKENHDYRYRHLVRMGELNVKETYLEQKKTYEQLLMRMQENIEKQKVAVSKMAQVELLEVDGFEMLEGQMKLQN